MSENYAAAVGNDAHPLAERGYDSYPTPPEAVRALLGVERIPARVWEPACGAGNIVKVLRETGRTVIATDIIDRGCPDSSLADFTEIDPAEAPSVDAIVTNPPFNMLKHGWVERCLAFAPKVYLLLRLNFLAGQKRRELITRSGLVRVHIFDERLPMMHREGWEGPMASSRMDFAWYVWHRGHKGKPTINRISWRKPLPPKLPPADFKPRNQLDLFANGEADATQDAPAG